VPTTARQKRWIREVGEHQWPTIDLLECFVEAERWRMELPTWRAAPAELRPAVEEKATREGSMLLWARQIGRGGM
jgi:hypothetical protein